jgi:CheY-like chemotaxis protein
MSLVLIVEDEETLRTAEAKFLRRVGFDVREAATGREGVEAALTEPVPDAILMDIMLPELNGVQATRLIRENPRTAGVPVIACTGAVLGPVSIETAGFVCVLQKPYSLSDLLTVVREYTKAA